jgi:hypothetical protein
MKLRTNNLTIPTTGHNAFITALNSTLEEVMSSDVYIFMKINEYSLFSRTYNTLIFRENTK